MITRITIQPRGASHEISERSEAYRSTFTEVKKSFKDIAEFFNDMAAFASAMSADPEASVKETFIKCFGHEPIIKVYTKKKRTYSTYFLTITEEDN